MKKPASKNNVEEKNQGRFLTSLKSPQALMCIFIYTTANVHTNTQIHKHMYTHTHIHTHNIYMWEKR